MISFIVCIVVLVVGYFVYGRLMTRIFGPDDSRMTPAVEHPDGVDYIPMPTWKIFLIQFLNIAGVGPIFGAILGAKYGTASFLWIVLGSIFAGGVHDYISGMLSVRNNGASMPEVVGKYLGTRMGQFMRFYGVLLLVLVGVVFVASPAGLLARLTPHFMNATWWIVIIFLYYILATLLPIDKIIGRIYPLFAIAMLFMAVGIMVALFVHWPSEIPELTDGMQNINPNGLPIFPFVFVSIACGAVSGFHGTQNPLMARCMKKESEGRPVFYGAMITEGIVALIWAAAATYFYHSDPANLAVNDAATVVFDMSKHW
ncbi:MAG: carbon starvation protein A, partial [Bacteroidales bacterium]|nr:carbon starvation protein A [Bacteroidales bacterium]